MAGAIAGAFLAAATARAEFAPPIQVTSAAGAARHAALSVDPASNVYVVSATDAALKVDLFGPNLRLAIDITGFTGTPSDPDILTNSRGTAALAFCVTAEDGSRHVYFCTNAGGRFGAPVPRTEGSVVDKMPKLALDLDGNAHVVWERELPEEGEPSRVFYLDTTAGESKEVATGSAPSVFIDHTGRVHLAYARAEGIYYTSGRGGEFDEETLAVSAPSPKGVTPTGRTARLVVDESGNVFLLYTNDGAMFFTAMHSGLDRFTPPRFVDSGGIGDAELRIRNGGVITIVYIKDADVYFVQGIADFLLRPSLVTVKSTPGEERDASLIVDNTGNLHVCFVLDGEVHYTNNATDVRADFTADPPTGQGPLRVKFRDLSSGQVQIWQWDFGDGEHSTQTNPVHTYALPGEYDVTLTVFNADRQSTIVKERYITVQESNYTMQIPNQAVLPNQAGVWFPVLGSHLEPVQGFQVHVVFDPTVLTLRDCTQENTVLQAIDPDVWECNEHEHSAEVGVIFELEPPFTVPDLVPGNKQTLVNLVFDVSNGAPQGGVTEVRLVNNLDISRIFNIFIVRGFAYLPVLKPSRVDILPIAFPLPDFFLRGDADGSSDIDITDAILLLNFLFLGGREPACMDAADVQDAGRVDISSAISLLNYLFLGGSSPAVPFPNIGIDPSPDSLPPCD